MSPTHETHPRKTIIINLVYSFPNIQQCKMYELRRLLWNYIEKILDKFSNMQLFARKYLQAVRYRYTTSTADPGHTAWRLLHLETRGLTVTLLFTTTTTTTNQKVKTTGRFLLPTNSSLQTLKLQPHASPHLGTDLRIAQLSNTGSFNHHLSTTGRAFATNAGTQN
uniref:Uncharacterized protein n=1 Tax=Vespula pensylvanica TaxID=30213 RepID=A0A834P138_VESPE|nr:hypothetical protein H0235_008960 [Vespula pensylvanica]